MDLHGVPSLRAIIFLQFHQKLWQWHECKLQGNVLCHCAPMLDVARSTLIPPRVTATVEVPFFTHICCTLDEYHTVLKRLDIVGTDRAGGDREGIALHLNSRLAFVPVITAGSSFIAHIKPFRCQPRTFPRFFVQLHCHRPSEAKLDQKKGKRLFG